MSLSLDTAAAPLRLTRAAAHRRRTDPDARAPAAHVRADVLNKRSRIYERGFRHQQPQHFQHLDRQNHLGAQSCRGRWYARAPCTTTPASPSAACRPPACAPPRATRRSLLYRFFTTFLLLAFLAASAPSRTPCSSVPHTPACPAACRCPDRRSFVQTGEIAPHVAPPAPTPRTPKRSP
jgi:hypothetical protein